MLNVSNLKLPAFIFYLLSSIFAVLFVFSCSTGLLAQPEDSSWFVLERFLPRPVSRADYVMVSRASGGIEGWRIVKGSMTFAQAVAFADEYRLGEQFKTACDNSYSVYRNPDTNQLGVSRDVVPSRLLVKPWVCCEEAYEIAFPTPSGTSPATNDCRSIPLASLPGMPLARLTPDGWFFAGTQDPIDPRNLTGRDLRGGTTCRRVTRMNQAESRDSNGRILTEAATINVLNCQGREIYVYEYLNRSGFRAVEPPNWGTALGGRDFGSYEEALQAIERPHDIKEPPIVNPFEKYRAYWGTWRGTKVANGITIVIRPDGTGSYVDTRPGYERNTPNGRWAASDKAGCIVAIHFRLCIQPDGTAHDPWLNVYTK